MDREERSRQPWWSWGSLWAEGRCHRRQMPQCPHCFLYIEIQAFVQPVFVSVNLLLLWESTIAKAIYRRRGLQFQRVKCSSWQGGRAVAGMVGGRGCPERTPSETSTRQIEWTRRLFKLLKPILSDIFQRGHTPPKWPQTVPLTGELVFKCMNL